MHLLNIYRVGFSDFLDALKMLKVAFYFAYSETLSRYRRSILGPLWMVLGTAVGVLGLGFVWSTIFGLDKKTYVPMLCIGLVIWQFIAGALNEASGVFTRESKTLLSIRTPTWFFTFQLVIKWIINFGHSILIIFLVWIFYPPPFHFEMFKSILGFSLLILNLLWVCHVLAYMGARYRDIEPLVSALMPLIFFLTPVIYRAQHFDGLNDLIFMNPLSYRIDSIREPLLGHPIDFQTYLISALIAIFGLFVAVIVTGFSRRKVAYWL